MEHLRNTWGATQHRYGGRLSPPKPSLLAAALVGVLVIAMLAYSTAGSVVEFTLTYRLDSYGLAHVTLIVTGVSNTTESIVVPLEPGYVRESILVVSSSGEPLPYTVNDTTLTVYTSGLVESLVASYDAIVGEASSGVVRVVVHPFTASTIYLPKGAALLAVNGTPVIQLISGTIVLRYSSPGVYAISFLAPQPLAATPTATTTPTTTTTATTTTTVTTTTQTATTTTTTRTTTTWTTTTTTKPARPTATQTTTTTSTTTGKPATTTATTKPPAQPTTTSHTTTATPATTLTKTGAQQPPTGTTKTTQAATTPGKPSTTVARTTTTGPGAATSTKTQTRETTTTARRMEGQPPLAVLVAVPIIAGIALGGYIAYKHGKRRRGEEGHQTVETSILDERDRAIIDLLAREGPLSLSEIARRLGYSKSTVHRHLNKLTSLGILERTTHGRQTLYRLKKREG